LAAAAAAIDHLTSEAGRRQRQRAHRRAGRLRQRLEREGWTLVANADPLRLVVATAPDGLDGFRADAWLMARGVIVELPEPGALTFTLGLEPPRALERRLPPVLAGLRRALGGAALPPFPPPPLPLLAALDHPLGEAWRAETQTVPLAESAGRIAAEPICPYPPGIPLLVPGERIDSARATWLDQQRRHWPGQIADSVKVVAERGGF
jgi:lysine decarboxylase